VKTRQRIKDIAVSLFNEKGATNISTVHIAEEAGISPGNLYYYFENKEHIIRSIWEEDMVPMGDNSFQWEEDAAPEEVLEHILTKISDYFLTYRFFYTELYILLRNDSVLQEKYRQRWDRLLEKLTGFFSVWESKGYMRTTSSKSPKVLAEDFMITSPAIFQTFLAIHPECEPKEALHRAIQASYVFTSGFFVDETCRKMIKKL